VGARGNLEDLIFCIYTLAKNRHFLGFFFEFSYIKFGGLFIN
jgi:hypothetical protein